MGAPGRQPDLTPPPLGCQESAAVGERLRHAQQDTADYDQTGRMDVCRITELCGHCGGVFSMLMKQGISLAPDPDQPDMPLNGFYTCCARCMVS